MDISDTIFALATPYGSSALAIVRISGPLCEKIAQEACSIPLPCSKVATLRNYRSLKRDCIDQVVATYFRKGHSYTGDATLELCTHGNPLIVELIFQDLIERGCRAAEPGEFTRNAFLNGRIDLTQAEAIATMISASSKAELKVANNNLKGRLRETLLSIQEKILNLKAKIEVGIDFPEEDIPEEDRKELSNELKDILRELNDLAGQAEQTNVFKGQIKVLLVGPPNVGKSTLFNELIGIDRALVSPSAGTTRDYISNELTLGDFKIELIDAAGIRESDNRLENAGILKTLSLAKRADLILCILDSSLPFPDGFFEKLGPNDGIARIIIENKSDLTRRLKTSDKDEWRLSICSKDNSDVKKVKTLIEKKLTTLFDYDPKCNLLVESRHRKHLMDAVNNLCNAQKNMIGLKGLELSTCDIDVAMNALGEIVGEKTNEQVLDALFKNFCIGK